MRRWLLLALCAGFVLSGCGSTDNGPGGARLGGGGAVPVTVVPVREIEWVDYIKALGTARAKESVTLTAKVTETVERVNFSDGAIVEAGAILVELTGRAELAALREAQATSTEASRLYERNVELSKQRTVSESVLDTQRAARDGAKARADAIRARLGDRVISAPFAGELGFRRVSPGTLVTPGTEITTLDDTTVIKLDFSVPESFFSALAVGQAIKATSVAYPGREFDGTISSLDSRVDPLTRAIIVRALIPNRERLLRPGMLLSVDVLNRPRQASLVPELAVSAVGDRQFVYRVGADKLARQVVVLTGARRDGMVEIVDGLAAGDRVVTDGLVRMRDGIKVDVITPEQPAAANPAAQAAGT